MRILGPALAVLLVAPAVAQPPANGGPAIVVPDWALPDSPTHRQVPPPLDFHRAPVTFNTPIGLFENQTDVGAALGGTDLSGLLQTAERQIRGQLRDKRRIAPFR